MRSTMIGSILFAAAAVVVIELAAAQQALLLAQHTSLMNFYNALGARDTY